MLKRSTLRHACYRAKNGVATEENLQLLSHVEPLLGPGQTWNNFSVVWDVLVNNGVVKVIKPETDIDFIRNTCLEKHFSEVHKTTVNWSDRKANVISIVDGLMLDKLMTWENYNTQWGVDLDPDVKMIKTVMYNVPSSQIEVTPEMIEASKHVDALTTDIPTETPTDLTATPMTEDQRRQFEEFLARKESSKE